MVKKSLVNTIQELQEEYKKEIKNSIGPVVILGGHYPINRYGIAASTPCEFGSFGAFSQMTYDLAIDLVEYSKSVNKDVKIALVVDDHSQTGNKNWYMENEEGTDKIGTFVSDYFENFELPTSYKNKLKKKGLDESIFIKSKNGLPFQESVYRKEFFEKTNKNPGCSGEYKLILEEIAKTGVTKMLGYIPIVCQGPTCTGTKYFHKENKNLDMKVINTYLATGDDFDTPEEIIKETKDINNGFYVIEN